jgi:hypothetical protein
MITTSREHAHALLDRVPPDQMDAAVRFLEFLLLDPVARAAATAPADDEPVTEEDRRRVLEGKAALARGEQGIPMEDVLDEFGLKMEDFPLRKR